jgi:hypothetical protein
MPRDHVGLRLACLIAIALPPRSAACYYFARWRDDGTDQAIHDLLRWHAREKRGRKADPGLVVPDTQSVHAAASVPADTIGKDTVGRCPGASGAWPWTSWDWS